MRSLGHIFFPRKITSLDVNAYEFFLPDPFSHLEDIENFGIIPTHTVWLDNSIEAPNSQFFSRGIERQVTREQRIICACIVTIGTEMAFETQRRPDAAFALKK